MPRLQIVALMLGKEFRQVFRNRAMVPILFVMPVLQLVVLSFAATYEIPNARLFVSDLDRTPSSRELIRKFTGSGFFVLSGTGSPTEGDRALLAGKADLTLTIPNNLGKKLVSTNKSEVFLVFDAVNSAAAGVIQGYAQRILRDYNTNFLFRQSGAQGPPAPVLKGTPRFWFNPELDYQTFMVPGILVLLISMVGVFLGSMNVVREKEIGTIEQINVTPIGKTEFLLGKLLPFWLIGMVELTIGLVIAKLIFDVPMIGSLFTVYLFAGIYMVAMLGMGLLISTISDTQQQAMFLAWFFTVIFILLSGLFTPVDSMPEWAQWIARSNPIAYFVDVMRMVLLKGASVSNLSLEFSVILGMALFFPTLAVKKYQKTI